MSRGHHTCKDCAPCPHSLGPWEGMGAFPATGGLQEHELPPCTHSFSHGPADGSHPSYTGPQSLHIYTPGFRIGWAISPTASHCLCKYPTLSLPWDLPGHHHATILLLCLASLTPCLLPHSLSSHYLSYTWHVLQIAALLHSGGRFSCSLHVLPSQGACLSSARAAPTSEPGRRLVLPRRARGTCPGSGRPDALGRRFSPASAHGISHLRTGGPPPAVLPVSRFQCPGTACLRTPAPACLSTCGDGELYRRAGLRDRAGRKENHSDPTNAVAYICVRHLAWRWAGGRRRRYGRGRGDDARARRCGPGGMALAAREDIGHSPEGANTAPQASRFGRLQGGAMLGGPRMKDTSQAGDAQKGFDVGS